MTGEIFQSAGQVAVGTVPDRVPGTVGNVGLVKCGSDTDVLVVDTGAFVGFVVIELVLVVVDLPPLVPWPPVGIPEIAGQGGSVSVRTWVSPPRSVIVVITATMVTLAIGVIVLVPSFDVMLTL